jgi:hypothetical protein
MKSRVLFVGIAVLGLLAAGCSDADDDGASSQESYCEAGQSLESSVNALSGLIGVDEGEEAVGQIMDAVVESSDDLDAAVDAIEADVSALREAASEAAADDVDALDQAMDDLANVLSDLGSDLDLDKALAVQESAQGARAAAQAVYDTLTDCP